MIPMFLGYDPREAIGYSVFCHSVLSRTKAKVSFIPVCGDQEPGSSNTFNKERFKIPEMQGYRGWAIYMDGSDMLCRGDIEELWSMRRTGFDVMCVKHDYRTKYPTKFLGARNEDYPMKNWSSVMLIDCGNPVWRRPAYRKLLEGHPGDLHRFAFIDDERIGEIPMEWNWISGEYPFNPDAKLAHFSIGLPCWKPYSKWDYSSEWFDELKRANHFTPWEPAENFDDSPKVSDR